MERKIGTELRGVLWRNFFALPIRSSNSKGYLGKTGAESEVFVRIYQHLLFITGTLFFLEVLFCPPPKKKKNLIFSGRVGCIDDVWQLPDMYFSLRLFTFSCFASPFSLIFLVSSSFFYIFSMFFFPITFLSTLLPK